MPTNQELMQRIEALEQDMREHYHNGVVGRQISMQDLFEYIQPKQITTTTSSTATFMEYLIPDNSICHIKATVVALRVGGSSGSAGDCASYVLNGLYKNVSGTVSLVGSVTVVHSAESQSGWDATLVISGKYVLVQVTGATNNTVSWHAQIHPYPYVN